MEKLFKDNMTDKKVVFLKYENYIKIIYSKTYNSAMRLDYYLQQFNIEDYWIYKSTNKQKQVSIEELYDFNYSGYILFKKDKYDYKEIDESLKLKEEKIGNHAFSYLNKPLPPLSIIKKIKIKE
jgi:hypothetical protein